MNDALAGVGPSGGGKAGKGSAAASKTGTILKDFKVEVAKSGGAGCRVCEVKIAKVRKNKTGVINDPLG